MKSIIVAFFLLGCTSFCYAQFGIGASASFSTGKFFSLDVFYIHANEHRFHLGYSSQSNGQKNNVVSERKLNYGRTKTGSGMFMQFFDLGYSQVIKEKLTLHPEVSLGNEVEFNNYADKRFSDNGYSLISRTNPKAGVGLNIGYIIAPTFELFAGFHTLKKINFGARLFLPSTTQ